MATGACDPWHRKKGVSKSVAKEEQALVLCPLSENTSEILVTSRRRSTTHEIYNFWSAPSPCLEKGKDPHTLNFSLATKMARFAKCPFLKGRSWSVILASKMKKSPSIFTRTGKLHVKSRKILSLQGMSR